MDKNNNYGDLRAPKMQEIAASGKEFLGLTVKKILLENQREAVYCPFIRIRASMVDAIINVPLLDSETVLPMDMTIGEFNALGKYFEGCNGITFTTINERTTMLELFHPEVEFGGNRLEWHLSQKIFDYSTIEETEMPKIDIMFPNRLVGYNN